MSQIFMVPGTYDENLAHVEPGDVASRNYAAGEFLTWKGVLHSVKTAISTGETFVEGTNVQDESEGGLANALSSSIFDRLQLDAENAIDIRSYTSANNQFTVPTFGVIIAGSTNSASYAVKGFYPNSIYTGRDYEHVVMPVFKGAQGYFDGGVPIAMFYPIKIV